MKRRTIGNLQIAMGLCAALCGCARGVKGPPATPPASSGPSVARGQEPPQKPKTGAVWVNPQDGTELVFVAAGKFLMGTKDGGEKSERPLRELELTGYWITRTEVTNEQFSKFVKAEKFVTFAEARGKDGRRTWKDSAGKGGLPVVRVARDDAMAYAKWAGGRLPTEAEWERAARGADGRKFPWGNTWDAEKCVNSSQKKKSEPHEVGTLKAGASPCGAVDLSGNVWEWVADWWDAGFYVRMDAKNPQQTKNTRMGVIRGGSYATKDPGRLRCAKRQAVAPYANLPDVGFRYVVMK